MSQNGVGMRHFDGETERLARVGGGLFRDLLQLINGLVL